MRVIYIRGDSFLSRARKDLKKRKFVNKDGHLDIRFNPLAVDDGMCCMPVRQEPRTPDMVLTVTDGTYEVTGSRHPLLRLVVEVVKHRASHWWRGEGWRD